MSSIPLFANLPLGTPGTPGAWVDVSRFGRHKSLVIDGPDDLKVDIQFSHDGTNPGTLRSIKSKPAKQRLDIATLWMRASIPAGAVAPTNADIAAVEVGSAIVTLNVPNGVGVGTASGVASLGEFNTLLVGGMTDGELVLEISEDDVSWEPCLTATVGIPWAAGEFTAKSVRVNRTSGTGTPTAHLVAQNADASFDPITAGSGGTIIWAPDKPGGDVAGVLFTEPGLAGFKKAFDACRAVILAGGVKVELAFDPSYSTDTDSEGAPTCRVPTAAAEPNAVWDIQGIVLGGGWSQVGGDGFGVSLTNADGGVMQPSNGDIWVNIAFGNIINESAVDSMLQLANGFGICQGDGNSLRTGAAAGAAPLIKPHADAGFFYFCSGMNGLGGIGLDATTSPAPVVDLAGTFTVLESTGSSQWLADESLTDSVGGGTADIRGVWKVGRSNGGAGIHTGLGEQGAVGASTIRNRQRFPLKVPVAINQYDDSASPITSSGTDLTPGINYVDPTAGDVNVNLPFAAPIAGREYSIINNGSANNAIADVAGPNVRNVGGVADTIDNPSVPPGAKATWVCNGALDGSGVGHWERTSFEPVADTGFTQTFSTEEKDHAARTAVAPNAITGYAAHAAGGVTVTSTAATDLDTTAAAVATMATELSDVRDQLEALRADQIDTAEFVNSVKAAMAAADLTD